MSRVTVDEVYVVNTIFLRLVVRNLGALREEITQKITQIKNQLQIKANEFPVTLDDIIDFLYRSYGSTNILEIVSMLTNNETCLIPLLSNIHDFTSDRNPNSSINRIEKCLLSLDSGKHKPITVSSS